MKKDIYMETSGLIIIIKQGALSKLFILVEASSSLVCHPVCPNTLLMWLYIIEIEGERIPTYLIHTRITYYKNDAGWFQKNALERPNFQGSS